MNGERFYLLQDESALRQHDETHLFKVGIDGDKLADDLDEALGLLSKESAKIDAYAGTYSPDRSERDFDRLGKDPFHKMGRNRVLRDDGLLRNLDARPFGLPDWLLLQVVSLMQGPLNEQAFIQFANSWASHLRLLTFPSGGEALRPGVCDWRANHPR